MPPINPDEGWREYSNRIFGISDAIDDAGQYCFDGELNIKDPSVIADRIRAVVTAYPRVLQIEPHFMRTQ